MSPILNRYLLIYFLFQKKIVSPQGEDEKDSPEAMAAKAPSNKPVSGAIGMMGIGSTMMTDVSKVIKPKPPPAIVEENKPPSPRKVDVIIVGAGLAGLMAAYNITKADRGVNVLVLEAKGRLTNLTFFLCD